MSTNIPRRDNDNIVGQKMTVSSSNGDEGVRHSPAWRTYLNIRKKFDDMRLAGLKFVCF